MTDCTTDYTGDTCQAWATEDDIGPPCDDGIDSEVLKAWLQVSSDILFNLTGRQWPGLCSRVERPCGGGCFAGLPLAPNTPASAVGMLRSVPWPYRDERRTCGCSSLSRVRLTGEPVTEVVEVLVDGEVVDPSEYMIANGRYLVGLRRADGTLRVWPNCQFEELATTEVGTFSVEYVFGAAPPTAGVRHAARLACQLALSENPQALTDGRCRLPRRVTTISRQGVTLAILDTFSIFKDGLTGLPEIDLWLASLRYGNTGRRASMSDPARSGARR